MQYLVNNIDINRNSISKIFILLTPLCYAKSLGFKKLNLFHYYFSIRFICLKIFTDRARATENSLELNKDHANGNKCRLLIHSLL